MHGGRNQEREDREVMLRIGVGEDVKVIAVVIAVPGRIPSAVAVGLGIPFDVGFVLDITAAEPSGSINGGSVPGEGEGKGGIRPLATDLSRKPVLKRRNRSA